MSDYPSYWSDTWVLKAIHCVLLPLVGVARVIQWLGGRIRRGWVYAGPDGVQRYTGAGWVDLAPLAQRFCNHDWVTRTADDDMTYTFEFARILQVTDVCKICGTEEDAPKSGQYQRESKGELP